MTHLSRVATLNDISTALLEQLVRDRRELPPPDVRRALRKAAGVSLADVADAVGVSRQAASMWELGHRSPGRESLAAYLDAIRQLRRVLSDVPQRETAAGGDTPTAA